MHVMPFGTGVAGAASLVVTDPGQRGLSSRVACSLVSSWMDQGPLGDGSPE